MEAYNLDRLSYWNNDAVAISDGRDYFAVPRRLLSVSSPTSLLPDELTAIQDYFFSDEAVKAALSVAPELLARDDKGSLIHGTTGARALAEALSRINLGPKDSFLDIGCGCGLPTLVASRQAGNSHGVDIVPSVVRFAKKAAGDLQSNATFEQADVCDIAVVDYDVVYLAATTFSEDLRRRLREKLFQLRAGAVVISITYSFSCPHLVLVDSFESPFAWWRTTTPSPHRFYIHVRQAA